MSKDILLSKHFKLSEFTVSPTALRLHIDNSPGIEIVVALSTLVACCLQPLRTVVNTPIVINSGYRSELLNNAVGGTSRSQHLIGEAADLSINEDITVLVSALLKTGIPFDQCIVYVSRKFMHISYKRLSTNRYNLIYK